MCWRCDGRRPTELERGIAARRLPSLTRTRAEGIVDAAVAMVTTRGVVVTLLIY